MPTAHCVVGHYVESYSLLCAATGALLMPSNPHRIFYSWQSDTPGNLNRTFIEKALADALQLLKSDAELEPALREPGIELDKDTQGVGGSPPIAETILRKIEECAAFVADLTFVGESLPRLRERTQRSRYFSNPNVLLEYGYALRCHGHHKLIAVMNTAFGDASPENLPFDLRHLRWPITYRLEAADDANKPAERKALAAKLAEALKLILMSAKGSPAAAPEEFLPYPGSDDPSLCFGPSDIILAENEIGRPQGPVVIPNEGRAWMRLYPKYATEPLDTELAARDLARRGGLRPMAADLTGWGHARNSLGSITYETPHEGKLYHFTQLFLTKELWGLDAYALNATHCHEFTEGRSNGYFASQYVERMFAETLLNYLPFARDHLGLQIPLRLEIGVSGVKGYPFAVRNGYRGSMLHDRVVWKGQIENYAMPVHEILDPFLKHLWAKGGLARPAEANADLIEFVSARQPAQP